MVKLSAGSHSVRAALLGCKLIQMSPEKDAMDYATLLERLSSALEVDSEGNTHEDFFGLAAYVTLADGRWYTTHHLTVHAVNDKWSCRVEPREAILHMPPIRLTRRPHPRTGNMFTFTEAVEGGVCPRVVPLIEWKSIEVAAQDGTVIYDSLDAARKGMHKRAEASGAWSGEE